MAQRQIGEAAPDHADQTSAKASTCKTSTVIAVGGGKCLSQAEEFRVQSKKGM